MKSPASYPWLDEHWAFFKRRLETGRLAHAMLIEGPTGCGKTVLARAMVARLLCNEDQDSACGQCRSCKLMEGEAHPDYFNLQPGEDSEFIKVDQVRGLIAKLDLTTSISNRKVAYIHPADSMNAAAANALLKSLEEPAGNAALILVSDNPGSLPVTIRSRCQAITVNKPDRQTVLGWLRSSSSGQQEELEAALQAAGGSPLMASEYLSSPELEAFGRVREGLASLLGRPASVSAVGYQLNELEPVDLWRWLSICAGDVVKSRLSGDRLKWMPANIQFCDKTLLQLQRQADINRRLSATPVRGDLLLQDWLIRWAEQVI